MSGSFQAWPGLYKGLGASPERSVQSKSLQWQHLCCSTLKTSFLHWITSLFGLIYTSWIKGHTVLCINTCWTRDQSYLWILWTRLCYTKCGHYPILDLWLDRPPLHQHYSNRTTRRNFVLTKYSCLSLYLVSIVGYTSQSSLVNC